MTGWGQTDNENGVRRALSRETRVNAKTDDRKGAAPMLGGASIIMVFAVLCLTIFAVLTLLTADSERKISESYEKSVADYYRADTEATAFASILAKALKTDGIDGFHSAAAEVGAQPAAMDADGAPTVEKSFPIDGNQALRVVIAADGGSIRVDSWQVVFTGEWVPDDGLNLWNEFAEQQE